MPIARRTDIGGPGETPALPHFMILWGINRGKPLHKHLGLPPIDPAKWKWKPPPGVILGMCEWQGLIWPHYMRAFEEPRTEFAAIEQQEYLRLMRLRLQARAHGIPHLDVCDAWPPLPSPHGGLILKSRPTPKGGSGSTPTGKTSLAPSGLRVRPRPFGGTS